MPFTHKSPDVYVEEVNSGARPIEQAGTSVLAMIGFCKETIQVEEPGKDQPVDKPTPRVPTLVTNWTQFTSTYGDMDQKVEGGYLHDAMYGYFLNGGTAAYVVGLPVPVKERVEPAPLQLPPAEGYLLNGAGARTLRIATTGPQKPGEQITVEVQPPAGDNIPEGAFTLNVKRGGADFKTVPNVTLGRGKGQRSVVDVLTRETDNLLMAEVLDAPGSLVERAPSAGSKVALAPLPQTAQPQTAIAPEIKQKVNLDLFRGTAAERTGIAGLEAFEDVTLVACPDAVAGYQWGVFTADDVKRIQTDIINHCEAMKNRFAILDCPPGLSVQDVKTWRTTTMNFDSQYAALYYPWLRVNDHMAPPSGHMAGIYARVDAERGVHKAPANEIVRGAIGLERNVSRNEQDTLNPEGVNCIRSFTGQGIRVWGARTLSSDARWRYIPVRRLFSAVEESILRGTRWIVFEPNDQILWLQIRRDLTSFLTVVWRSGALFGKTAEEAFYVKCDEETNPPYLRDRGYCVVEVGIAPVKPAEFVVFRISQKEDGAGAASE